jgi:hypothetical protein
VTSIVRNQFTGAFPYRVKLTGADTEETYTTAINVTPSPVLTANHTLSNRTVLLNLTASCTDCRTVVTTPRGQNISTALNATHITVERHPGRYHVHLLENGTLLDAYNFSVQPVPGRGRPSHVADAGQRSGQGTPTGRIQRTNPVETVQDIVSSLYTMVVFW